MRFRAVRSATKADSTPLTQPRGEDDSAPRLAGQTVSPHWLVKTTIHSSAFTLSLLHPFYIFGITLSLLSLKAGQETNTSELECLRPHHHVDVTMTSSTSTHKKKKSTFREVDWVLNTAPVIMQFCCGTHHRS